MSPRGANPGFWWVCAWRHQPGPVWLTKCPPHAWQWELLHHQRSHRSILRHLGWYDHWQGLVEARRDHVWFHTWQGTSVSWWLHALEIQQNLKRGLGEWPSFVSCCYLIGKVLHDDLWMVQHWFQIVHDHASPVALEVNVNTMLNASEQPTTPHLVWMNC